MPTPKVVDKAAMLYHITYLCNKPMFEAMMRANGAHKVRQQKRRNYIKRQSALARMVNELVGGQDEAVTDANGGGDAVEKKAVVVFGSAKFQ
jgi:hypothetical protein